MVKLKTKSKPLSTKALQEQILSLNRIGIALSEQHTLNDLLHQILTESRKFTNAEAGSLYIREENQLRFALSQNEVMEKRAREKEKREGIPASKTFTGFYLSLDKSSLAG